ncbi:EAL domain-containing protein [Rossellomorea vietnamensis]|uniref:EAL domain-containing protein n=1 Tax=Rossellomorea vietnamensis TaxID=218284 RepID=A0A5D4MB22_9BACI|nr:EAL domain-containing protein [Rossellomorea vietnamensis]TYR98902.1 EAL domain-containing protein [Rossellomorea vietnamensis]
MGNLLSSLRVKQLFSDSKPAGQLLQTDDDSFRFIFEHSPDIIIRFDIEGKVVDFNRATTSTSGYGAPEIDQHVTDFSPDHEKNEIWNYFKAAAKGKIQYYFTHAYHKNGTLMNLEITYIPIKQAKKITGVFALIREISEKVELQSQLQQKKLEMQHIYDSLEAGIWAYDVQSNSISACSKGVVDICETPAEDFISGKSQWRDFIFIEDLEKFDEKQKHLMNGERVRHQYRIITPSGAVKWISDQSFPVLDEDGTIFRLQGIVTDVTEDKKLVERVHHLQHHDSLTALPNRKTLETEMTTLIKEKTDFAMFYVDLNRFKYMNETLGPVIGDEILEEAARRLKRFQERGIFISRFSNDDFVLLFKEYGSLQEITSLCNDIVDCLKDPYEIREFELLLTISVGVCIHPSDSNGITELFQNSIAAMNRAKEIGKNSFHIYSPENSIDAYKRLTLEKDFRHALKNEELQLHFQPQVDSRLNQIVGAEALLRWDHSEWGLVSPNEFIPYAEENGFIINVGEWVLKEACKTIQEWRRRGIPLVPVSINLSPQHFLVKDLKNSLLSVLKKYEVPPKLIRLEITEAVFLQQAEVVKQTIDGLRECGIKILIDDFGTGYTSFTYLKDLTVDGIKIDRSYTKELGNDSKNRAIIKNLASLSADLNMTAVIEGIETKEQLKFLKQIKCHLIQGYIYSKPVPADDFERLLKGKTIKPLSEGSKNFSQERRRYFRMQPPVPLLAFATIASINNKEVTTGKTGIPVTDIGPGGLSFISHIQFPSNRDILLHFSMKVLGEEIVHTGKIVWKEEIDEEFFRYGVEFKVSEAEREALTRTFNTLSLAFKRDNGPKDTSLIEKDLFSFLREGKTKI